jgi:uncharacterized membrane protein
MDRNNNGCSLILWGCILLTIGLLALKLCGAISWPWIWIFSPLWILFDIFAAILIIALLLLAVYYFAKTIDEKKR